MRAREIFDGKVREERYCFLSFFPLIFHEVKEDNETERRLEKKRGQEKGDVKNGRGRSCKEERFKCGLTEQGKTKRKKKKRERKKNEA